MVAHLEEAKDKVQKEAREAFKNANYWGSLYMATGTGKTKVAIDETKDIVNNHLQNISTVIKPKILVVVPTVKLRDENWKDEFNKWTGTTTIWNNFIIRTCYASLHTIEDQDFAFVILDEGHHLTNDNSSFFSKNRVERCMLLTATEPDNLIKIDIFRELGFYNPCYRLPLNKARELGLVAPFTISVVHMKLNSTDRNIKVEYKDKRTGQLRHFYQTETERYEYLSRGIYGDNPMASIKRMQFIYDLGNKTKVAQLLLEHIIPKELRTLIFCGSKKQADAVCQYRYYSKPSKPTLKGKETPKKLEKYKRQSEEYLEQVQNYQGDVSLKLFQACEINRLSCVEALNEGHNFDLLDIGFIIQLNSQAKDLIQRMGRIIRIREDHTGQIIILCVDDTQDEEWVGKALRDIRREYIVHMTLEEIRTFQKVIKFD